jgi:hypothetical protein
VTVTDREGSEPFIGFVWLNRAVIKPAHNPMELTEIISFEGDLGVVRKKIQRWRLDLPAYPRYGIAGPSAFQALFPAVDAILNHHIV